MTNEAFFQGLTNLPFKKEILFRNDMVTATALNI